MNPPIRILLVEDTEDDYITTRDLLSAIQGECFDLEWVTSYSEGLAKLVQKQHEVCLVDYHLGQQNGLNLLQEAVARGCQAPIILLTTQADRAIDSAAVRAGAVDYLVKEELTPPRLARTIGSALENSRTRAELSQALWEKSQLAIVIAHISTGVVITDPNQPDNPVVFVNPAFTQLTGYTPIEMIGKNCRLLQGADTNPQTCRHIAEAIAQPRSITCTLLNYRRDGTPFWNQLTINPLFDTSGRLVNFMGLMTDVTAQKQAEAKLIHDSLYDRLTGLPNRVLLMERLQHAIQRSQPHHHSPLALLFIDLDRFKVINDSLGPVLGDQLLVAIARRLLNCLRPSDTIARLGGDEFVILLEDIKDTHAVRLVVNRIQRELSASFHLEGHEIFTTASIGIAFNTTGNERPEDLLRDADTALYQAKAQGRGRHALFHPRMHTHAVALLQLETDLRRAIERNQLLLYYQPLVCLRSRRIVGFEALLRWHHPQRGLISPAEFIPVAEETGLILPIGWWALREACRQMHQWRQQFPSQPQLTVNVNLSSKQLTPQLTKQVRQILQETGLEARYLKLELTESALMQNAESAVSILTELQRLGIHLAIDDFGTGYSSLSYLHRLPIDTLKIDRSFTSKVDIDGEQLAIVRTIMTLAWNLGMEVVAEGIETPKQLAQLRALRCEYAQGYLFAKPLDAAAAERLISQEVEDRQLKRSIG